MRFYDTCALLTEQKRAFLPQDKFLISSITLKELETIKVSTTKDPDVKFRARKVLHLLAENEEYFSVVPFQYEDEIKQYPILQDNNDSRIILTALKVAENNEVHFITEDLSCYHIAKSFTNDYPQFYAEYLCEEADDEYTGFKQLTLSDEELAIFYSNYTNPDNIYNMKINEYLIISNEKDEIIDQYKFTEDGFKQVPFSVVDSEQLGKIKPKDIYQRLAIDSLKKNRLTALRGPAGSGKSLIAMGYLFERLEHGDIDKIIIFCNTVATSGSAKLGYYPGSRTEKLLDSQIGNFLISKLGDRFAVERLIDDGELLLLPMSDIRGFDTTGMKAGIYITEAQNLDIELMKLALQRIGDDSICILDGDDKSQVDLPIYAGRNNGLRRVSAVFRGDPCYGEVVLQNIYRGRIARIAQNM